MPTQKGKRRTQVVFHGLEEGIRANALRRGHFSQIYPVPGDEKTQMYILFGRWRAC